MSPFLEHLKLNFQFIGFSRRLAVITIIGLSISVAMVSENILFLDSFRYNAFEEFTESTSDPYIEVSMNHVGTQGSNLISIIRNSVTVSFEELDIEEEYLLTQEWFPYKPFFLLLNNEILLDPEFHTTYLIGINYNYLPLLEARGRILWVAGLRLSEVAKVRSETQRVVYLRFQGPSMKKELP